MSSLCANFWTPDAETRLDLGLLKPIFRSDLKSKGLLHYPTHLRHAEDFALYAKLLRKGVRFVLLREAYYRFSTRMALSGGFSPGKHHASG